MRPARPWFGVSGADRDWRLHGNADPYDGIAAPSRHRHAPADLDDFFGTGEIYMLHRLTLLHRQFGPLARGRALDFGCGVGRVTLPLADEFGEVVGLDIAPAALAKAERLRLVRGVTNVQFRPADNRLTWAQGEFDFVHSYIAFQHIGVARGLTLIAQLLDRVALDGVVSIHVAIGHRPRSWVDRVPGLRRVMGWLGGRRAGEPMARMHAYPTEAIFAMLHLRGFGPVLTDVERHGPFLTMHIAARRLTEAEKPA